MGRRKKLIRFAELKTLENVFEVPFEVRGEVILEVGCGAGNYTLALARKYPQKTFIGVDVKGDRIWRGAKKALLEGLKNVFFLKTMAEKLPEFFDKNSISEIWITFPDPFPKPSKAGKRLCSERFLEIYKKILKPGGAVNFKTDNEALFNFGLSEAQNGEWKITKELRDVHKKKNRPEILKIITYYEEKFIREGRKIFYSRFVK